MILIVAMLALTVYTALGVSVYRWINGGGEW